MVGQLTDKHCDLLIKLEQYRSLNLDPAEFEELKQKVESSIRLVERTQKFEEREKGLLATVRMREEQIKVSDEGKTRVEG